MKKSILIIPFALLVISACNKNQKVVKQLDGDWKLTGEKVNGTAVTVSDNITYHFDKCKVKNEDCDGSMSFTDSTKGSITLPMKYNVTEDGTKFTTIVNILGSDETTVSDIVEHSKSKFVFSYTDSGGDVWEETLEKL